MAEWGGIFIDVLTRLNMKSVEVTLKELNKAFKTAGVEAARAFSAPALGLDRMEAQFGSLADVSEAAFGRARSAPAQTAIVSKKHPMEDNREKLAQGG